MGRSRKSTLSLLTRRGIPVFRWSRFSKRAGKRKTTYVVTTPKRRISQHRLTLIRNSMTLKKALGKRRRQQLRHPRRISASRKAMHARETRLLWGSPAARARRSRRNRSRRVVRRVSPARRVARSPARRFATAVANVAPKGLALQWARARCAGVKKPCNKSTKSKWLMSFDAYKAQQGY